MYLSEEVSLCKSWIRILGGVMEISMIGDISQSHKPYNTGCSKCKPDNLLQKWKEWHKNNQGGFVSSTEFV